MEPRDDGVPMNSRHVWVHTGGLVYFASQQLMVATCHVYLPFRTAEEDTCHSRDKHKQELDSRPLSSHVLDLTFPHWSKHLV